MDKDTLKEHEDPFNLGTPVPKLASEKDQKELAQINRQLAELYQVESILEVRTQSAYTQYSELSKELKVVKLKLKQITALRAELIPRKGMSEEELKTGMLEYPEDEEGHF